MVPRVFLAFAVIGGCFGFHAIAGSLEPVARFTISARVQGLPWWSGNALLVLDRDGTALPLLRLIDAQGSELPWAIQISIPEAVEVFVRGASRAPDGTVVVCGMAIDKDGRRGTYIATFAHDGSMKMLIRTDPYKAYRVAVARDGSFWTAGVEAANAAPPGSTDTARDVLKPYLRSGLIRHFDASGKLLASFLPQSTAKHLLDLVHPANYLAAGGERAGWYSAEDRRYVEINAAGEVTDITTRLPGPSAAVTGIAIINNGDVFAAVNYDDAGSRQHVICRLDRINQAWVPVRRENSHVLLYGAEGDVLVTETLGQDSPRVTMLRVGE